MDFTLGDGKWRTIGIRDARDALKEAKLKNSKATRKDLVDMMNAGNQGKDSLVSETDSKEDSTMVEESDGNESDNKSAQSYNHLSVITANASSPPPKLESLFDCCLDQMHYLLAYSRGIDP